jgi:hypothetical protein
MRRHVPEYLHFNWDSSLGTQNWNAEFINAEFETGGGHVHLPLPPSDPHVAPFEPFTA